MSEQNEPADLAQLVQTIVGWEHEAKCVHLNIPNVAVRVRWEPVLNRLMAEVAMPQALWGCVHFFNDAGAAPPHFDREHYGGVLLLTLLKYLDAVYSTGTDEDRRDLGAPPPGTYQAWFGPVLTIVWRT